MSKELCFRKSDREGRPPGSKEAMAEPAGEGQRQHPDHPSGVVVDGDDGILYDETADCCLCRSCTKRMATLALGVVSLVLSVSVVVPPAYVYLCPTTSEQEDKDYSVLFPLIKYGRRYLQNAAAPAPAPSSETFRNASDSQPLTPGETYRLAIFQLMEDAEEAAPTMALVSFLIGCLNVPLILLLLLGAATRRGCLMVPWLTVTLAEHLVLGLPLVVFVGLIALYLAAQLRLHLVALAMVTAMAFVFFLSLSTWATVYGCYGMLVDERYLMFRHFRRQRRPRTTGGAGPGSGFSGAGFNGGVALTTAASATSGQDQSGADAHLTQPLMGTAAAAGGCALDSSSSPDSSGADFRHQQMVEAARHRYQDPPTTTSATEAALQHPLSPNNNGGAIYPMLA